MLQSLNIRNVVLIDKLDIEFQEGLSVLTGETGAGKSILLDSLGLVLGNRAEISLIRQGEDKLSVTASFDLPAADSPLYELLRENDLELDGELIVKRSLSRDGKGKIFINDQAISAKLLKEIGRYLVEIHGQFDNQGLLNPANHRAVLDAFGAYPLRNEAVKKAYQAYQQLKKQRAEAEKRLYQAKEDEENLRHWIEELQKTAPRQGEEEELTQRRAELMNAEKILENLSYAYGVLTQGSDVTDAIRKAQSAVDKAAAHVEGKYDGIITALDQALIEVSDALSEIENASENISLDANEVNATEERLFALKALARKHQCGVDDLEQVLADFKERLAAIEYGEEGLDRLRHQEQEARLSYVREAQTLSKARKEAAARLDRLIMAELPPLKMEKAKFVTMVEALEESAWNENGCDNVYFTVATNPNSPQGPINKIASGGELSRFMLALKVNLAQSSNVEAMIFDEVDAGVGGATAQAVGERLARLAKDVQVLVVTHSPQVAARGNNHFKVEKSTVDNVTTTTVTPLTQEEKIEEIARMLAGEVITDEARANAKILCA